MTTFPLIPAQTQWVQEQISGMDIRRKVGQLFCPALMPDRFTAEQQIQDYAARFPREMETFAPAGYYLNRYYLPTTPHLINLLQESSPTPLFVCADMEAGAGGGLGGVIAPGLTQFPAAMGLGAAGSEQYAYLVGQKTALQAKTVGVNVVFAPVLDVNNNPDNPIINTRSFGEDPEEVSHLGNAFIQGLQDHGAGACAKHFPGHGDTSHDSHLLLSRITGGPERLGEVELYPFYRAIHEAGVYAIMTAHLLVPALEPDERIPATLSSRLLQNLLRREMGFEGVIVSDALLMGGITTVYEPGEAAVRALLAGVDLLLMPPDLEAAYGAVYRAVENGTISEERLHESLNRILSLKATLELNKDCLSHPDMIHDLLEHDDAEPISYNICCDAVTLVKNDDFTVPVSPDEAISVITFFDSDDLLCEPGEAFHHAIRHRSTTAKSMSIGPDSPESAFGQARRLIGAADTLIFGAVVNVLPEKDTVELPPACAELIEAAVLEEKNVILVSFGNPYLLRRFPQVQAYLCAYSYFDIVAEVAVEILFGERIPHGRLPVSIPDVCERGTGLSF